MRTGGSRVRVAAWFLAAWCGLGLFATPAVAYDLVVTPAGATFSEGVGQAEFTVTLAGCTFPETDVQIAVQLVGLTAAIGSDFGPPSASFLLIGDSASQAQFSVPIIQDTMAEGNETFELNLDATKMILDCGNQGPLPPLTPVFRTLVTIVDDDVVVPNLSIDDVAVVEGDSGTVGASFTLSLSAPTVVDVLLTAATADNTATVADSDYQATTETLLIPPGQLTRQFVVPVIGDVRIEGDEIFSVLVSEVVGANLVDGVGVGTIIDDDQMVQLPGIGIEGVEVLEGDVGTTTATFRVFLEEPVEVEVTVDASTVEGTATAGLDFEPRSSNVLIPAGATETMFEVQVIGDLLAEGDETFRVDLSNPRGAEILTDAQSATGTIVDDDEDVPPPPGLPALSIRDTSLDEGDAGSRPARFQLSLQPASETQVAVNFRTVDGSARAGEDYQQTAGTVFFSPGQTRQTLSIDVLGDRLVEPDERFFVQLENPMGAVLGDASGRGQIRDDDASAPPAQIGLQGNERRPAAPGSDQVVEVLITRDGAPAPGVEVTWGVEGDGTLVGGDSSTSGEDGVATITVRLGSTPGPVVVVARAPGGAQVQVTFDVSRPLTGLFPESTGEYRLAMVLEGACSERRLGGLCDYLFSLDDTEARAALTELTPREVASMERLALEGARSQLSNIERHLAGVRRAGQLGGSRVALELGGRSWEPTALWRVARGESALELPGLEAALSLRGSESSGQRAADDESDLGRDGRTAIFASGRLSTGERDATGREAGFEFDTTGFTLGFDHRLGPGLVLGGAVGYLDSGSDFGRDDGSLDVEGYSVSGFLTRYGERAYLDLVTSWGSNDYTLERHVDLPRAFGGANRHSLRGAPSGDLLSASLSVGADWGGAASFGIFGGLSWIDGSIDGYVESGGPAALVLAEQSVESLLADAGVEFTYAASFEWGVLLPQVRLSYLNEFEDDARLLRGHFAADDRRLDFVLPTEGLDRSYLEVGVGFTATFKRGRSFYLFWETDLERDDLESSHLTGGFRLEL